MRDKLALLSGSTRSPKKSNISDNEQNRNHSLLTSPDDIDRFDRSSQRLFDSASECLELVIAREDKSRHDHCQLEKWIFWVAMKGRIEEDGRWVEGEGGG